MNGYFGEGRASVATPLEPNLMLERSADGYGCGKGVVAAALGLTHFIDDRAECLHSIFFEGQLNVEAAQRGYMIHFGPDVHQKRIAKRGVADIDLIKLMGTGVPDVGAKAAQRAEALVDPQALLNSLDTKQREIFEQRQALETTRPILPPAGKPPPEIIALLKDVGAKLKELDEMLPKGFSKAYAKAAKRAAQVENSTARQDKKVEEQHSKTAERLAAKANEQAARWTCPHAQEHWAARLAADRQCTCWAEVLDLFGLKPRLNVDDPAGERAKSVSSIQPIVEKERANFATELEEAERFVDALRAQLNQVEVEIDGDRSVMLLAKLKVLRDKLSKDTAVVQGIEKEHLALQEAVTLAEQEQRKLHYQIATMKKYSFS
eukprot:SAG31_NODE_5282_length_2633_cov_2.549329_2_plen_377_part_00